ncbi:MAG: DUF3794 and LysM peptidoglycan-binding domain-containing protein [bacterium]
MVQQLQISEPVASRTLETEVSRTVAIPERLPPADRVVSVNARVEIANVTASTGNIVYDGIIRSTIFYSAAEEPSRVVSIRRNFNFTERVSVPGVQSGYDVNIEAGISDIDFYVINDKLLGVEYVVVAEIEVTVPERITFIEETEDIQLRKQRFRLQREVQERNFSRQLSATVRIGSDDPDIRRIVDATSDVHLVDIIAGENEIVINGVVRNDVLYLTEQGRVEYTPVQFSFTESFEFRDVTSEMSPFVEAVVLEEEVTGVDGRRVKKVVTVRFKILVIREVEVSIPTDIIAPEEIFPVRRTILVEQIVAEERTRIQVTDRFEIPEGNPDIARIIKVEGRVRAGTIQAEASARGVLIRGRLDVNIIYVASLPAQPVFFTTTNIPFSYFIDIPEVSTGMDVYIEVMVSSSSASRINEREINARVVLDVNLLVTETVRVSVITGVSGRPAAPSPAPAEFTRYTVQSGDSLYLIARRYGVTVERLVEINNITDPSRLEVGQQLLIPSG